MLDMSFDGMPVLRRSRRARAEATARHHEVVIVECEPDPYDLLCDHLADGGFMVTPVPDGPSCMDLVATRIPAAIILDIDSPYETNLDVLRSLQAWQCPSPVVVLSRRSDVREAVDVMKNGAVDVFERPLRVDQVLACLRAAVKLPTPPQKARAGKLQAFPGRELLTRRELEVVAHVAAGASNKEAGRILDISPRTVEVHRARIMEKLGARNAADLVRIVLSQRR